jgi:hypothetical protein
VRFALDPCRPAASRALSYLSLASVGEYGTIDALLGVRVFSKTALIALAALAQLSLLAAIFIIF